MLKFALPQTRTLKFALPPTPTPNASRQNIGGVGSPTRGAGVGHVDFMLFVSISFTLVRQCELSFQWNLGLSGRGGGGGGCSVGTQNKSTNL